jgi:hypothetical protein
VSQLNSSPKEGHGSSSRPLINDCLENECRNNLPKMEAHLAGRDRHEYNREFFFGIDPKERTLATAPMEVARRTHYSCNTGVSAYGDTQSETIAIDVGIRLEFVDVYFGSELIRDQKLYRLRPRIWSRPSLPLFRSISAKRK